MKISEKTVKFFEILAGLGITIYGIFILLTFGLSSGQGAFFSKPHTYTPWWESLLGGWMFLIPLFIYMPILILYKMSGGVITRTPPENKENSEKATEKPKSAFAILCRFLVIVGIFLYLQFIIIGYRGGEVPGISIPEPWAGGIRLFGVILLPLLVVVWLLKNKRRFITELIRSRRSSCTNTKAQNVRKIISYVAIILALIGFVVLEVTEKKYTGTQNTHDGASWIVFFIHVCLMIFFLPWIYHWVISPYLRNQMANKFEGVTDDSITKPNGKRKQIQRICKWFVICGGSLGAIAIIFALLFNEINKSHMRNVACVLSGIGFLVFFLGEFIRLMSIHLPDEQKKRLNTFEQDQILK